MTRIHDHFPEFWAMYPRRDGQKIGKADAEAKFRRIVTSEAVWSRLKAALTNYASRCNGHPKDAHRWLASDRWREWETMEAEPDFVDDLQEL